PNGPTAFIKDWLLRNRPQKKEEWAADYSIIDLMDEEHPLWLVLVTCPWWNGIHAHSISEKEPDSGLLWDTLVLAMQYPFWTRTEPCRPTTLTVPNNDRWISLKSHLQEIGIALQFSDEYLHCVDGVPELSGRVFLAWEKRHGRTYPPYPGTP